MPILTLGHNIQGLGYVQVHIHTADQPKSTVVHVIGLGKADKYISQDSQRFLPPE